MIKVKYFFLKILLLNGICLFAQSSEVYTWFDNEIGLENSSLYNGIEFINLYNPINNKHRFFEAQTFSNGNVSYDKQEFYNVALKYDLFEDQLIVKIENPKGTNQILLLKDKIENFEIEKKYFEYLKETKFKNDFSPGFYQLLTENENFKLYKRNRKKIDKGIKNNAVYYEFKEVKPIYVVKSENKYFEVKRKRDLTKRYPDLKKELSNFRWNSKNFKKNDSQLILAINKLGQVLEK